MLTGNNIDVKTLSANEILLNGVSLSGTNGSGLNIDENGNVEIAGNITMTGGTISWDSINKPSMSYSEIGGIKPPSDADNTDSVIVSNNNFTKIGSDYVYTGTIEADQINTNGLKVGVLEAKDSSGTTRITAGGADYGYYEMRFYGQNSYQTGTISGTNGQLNISPQSGNSLVLGGPIYIDPTTTVNFQGATVTGLNTVAVFG
ncbi:hypothetical protein P9E34_14100 [Schinkia azotoformans]|uniref:hypothetical protein n=1 Tax=Schinkia azotoformans TaxID=1454 RepID=UPI002DBB20BF|nr:hypothetical protein [Schinkia azotoformans]MEC1725846.1 hypothetical protein [Schinkia azotoformans]